MSLTIGQSPPVAAASMAGFHAPDPRATNQLAAGRKIDRPAAMKAARQLVGETFFGMLLKELRKSASKNHPLYGGRGEETMQPFLDQYLARRLAESRRFDLAEAIVDRIGTERSPSSAAQDSAGNALEGDRRLP